MYVMSSKLIACFLFISVAIMVVIVGKLDLHLPVQSVPITIKVVSSNPAQFLLDRGIGLVVFGADWGYCTNNPQH
jgi:hypothetical protein